MCKEMGIKYRLNGKLCKTYDTVSTNCFFLFSIQHGNFPASLGARLYLEAEFILGM